MAQMMPFQVPTIAKVSLGQGLFAMAHHIWSPDIPIASYCGCAGTWLMISQNDCAATENGSMHIYNRVQ